MEGRAEQVKLPVCVIQHRAVEVYALLKIHLDEFDHEVSCRHTLTALPLGNRRLAEPQSPSVLCWPKAGWDVSDVPGRAKRSHRELASSYQVRTPWTCRMHFRSLICLPDVTTSRPIITHMDANRSGRVFVHLRGRSSAVKLGRHVITYRKAVGPILHIRFALRKAAGDYTVCWWDVLRRLCPCGISPILICLRCLFRRHLSPETGVQTDRHTERLTQHQQR
jgi:hypothetical protein